MTSVLGVDGWSGGWLGALVSDPDRPGPEVRWLLLPDAAAVRAVPAEVIAIDIPIGLPDSGRRTCDGLARREPGMNPSSVFPVPPRAVLAAPDYPSANALSRVTVGVGLSKQSWFILPKVRDVDDALGEPPDPRIVEVHPEVSFRRLDPRVEASKKTAVGVGQRLRALARWLDADSALADVPQGPGLDDALDALVAAWTAARWRDGRAVVLPPDPPSDGRGRPMRIVA